MELALVHKENLHKLIRAEDEFFYPLIMETPLLHSRFIGKDILVKLKSGWEVKGVFLGTIQESLSDYFKKHSAHEESPTFVEFDSEKDWLLAGLHSKFDGVRFYSQPTAPPFFVVLQEIEGFLLFTAYSESEQADLPKINYNLIITNEAIDKLVNHVKRGLPRAARQKRKTKRPSVEAKQLRLGKFFRG